MYIKNTSKSIERRLKKGNGHGVGKKYKPWLTVRSFGSRGLSSQIPGYKTGRVHHTLSQLESGFMYILDFCQNVVDIREQVALLPLTETEAIAKQLGVRHPTDTRTKQHIIMTTDFQITLMESGVIRHVARSIKQASSLESKRILEKLEIERIYWLSRKTDWGIVTERELPVILTRNCGFLHPRLNLDGLGINAEDIEKIVGLLAELIIQPEPLRKLTGQCDDLLGLESGTSLAVAYHLIAKRHWRVDLHRPIDAGKILEFCQPEGSLYGADN